MGDRSVGAPPPISNLMVPNELSGFGPSSKIKPSHKIRQKMMTREFKGGLGPHVNWERKEKSVRLKSMAMAAAARLMMMTV